MKAKWGLLLLAFCITGCSQNHTSMPYVDRADRPKGEEKTKLEILYSKDDITWSLLMDDLCSKFERENPDIDLVMQDPGTGLYEENLKVKEALNEFPDIFEIQNQESYIENNRLGEIPESVSELIEKPTIVNHNIYTVPLYTTTYGIIYNQAIFKQYGLEPPKNYQEFLDICETLYSKNMIPIACGGTKEDNVINWLNYFYQYHTMEESADNPEDSNDTYYMKMLENYSELMNSKYILKDSAYMNDSQIISALLSSKAAMYYTKPSFIANIILVNPDSMNPDRDNLGMEITDEDGAVRLDWFFIPLETGRTIATTEIGSQFAISKECEEDSQKYKAAERFFLFLFHDDNYREILKSMYGFQTTKKRVLYPAPSVQQGLIVDYRYAEKSASFLDTNHVTGASKNELTKTLLLLSNHSLSVEESMKYLQEKQVKADE